jgi:hypothetical protein
MTVKLSVLFTIDRGGGGGGYKCYLPLPLTMLYAPHLL